MNNIHFLFKWIFIAILALLVVASIGYGALIITFYGGLGSVLLNMKSAPNPESAKLISLRQETINVLTDVKEEIPTLKEFTYFESVFSDKCYKGQNNYKVKDGYAYRCTYRTTHFYGFDSDFKGTLQALHQDLISKGWVVIGRSIDSILHQYYDKYYEPSNAKPSSLRDQYLVSDMPKPSYRRGDVLLSIGYAEQQTTHLFPLEYSQKISSGFTTWENQNLLDVSKKFPNMTSRHRYILTVALEQHYFEN